MIAKAAAIAHGSTNVRYSTEKDLSEIVKGLLTIPSCLGSFYAQMHNVLYWEDRHQYQ